MEADCDIYSPRTVFQLWQISGARGNAAMFQQHES